MDVSGENFSPVQPVAIVGVALRFPGIIDPLSFHDLTLSGRRPFQLGYGPGPGGITPCHALAAEAAAAAIADTRLDRDWTRDTLARWGRSGAIVASCPPVAAVPAPLMPPIGAWVEQRLGLAGLMPSRQRLSPQEVAASAIGCSLRAVAIACEALARGEFDLMLAGGVAIGSGGGSDARNLAIRVYDANPTGVAPGEGCGMVALMRAADARAAGLPAYAEIAGWSSSEDGPDLRAVISGAYLRAGIDPADVQLVEGHGAATAADDQAELAALLDVLDRGARAGMGAAGRDGVRDGCALGSVAANLGDTRGAAGVAALLKTSLAMAAATIPPATGCVEPHQLLRERDETIRLPRTAEEWPDIKVRLAGVNSLGAATPGTGRSGGTHLVLRRDQDARLPGRRRRVTSVRGIPPQGSAPRGSALQGSGLQGSEPRDGAPAPRSCPFRYASPEPRRPRRVILPLPRSPQDFQWAPQPLIETPPISACQPQPQRPLPSAGSWPQGVPQAPRAAEDGDPGLVSQAIQASTAEQAAVASTAEQAAVASTAEQAGAAEEAKATRAARQVSGPAGQGPPGQPARLPAQPAAPYLRLRELLALESAAIIDRLAMAKATAPAPVPGKEVQPAEPRREAGQLIVHDWGGEAGVIVTLCGRDRADLIARLDEIALRTAGLSGSRLHELARGLPALTVAAADEGARAALIADSPADLIATARQAAEILRLTSPGPLRSWPTRDGGRQGAPGGCPTAPGVYLSEGAEGRVALVFCGLAWTSADHVRVLSTSAATIEWGRRLGIDARVAAGFGLGEIIGLAWAEAITHDEAARLAALRAEILRPMGGLTSMARVHADREATARLLAGTQLVRAVDEGPGQQVVAGPLPSVRALPYRAVDLGVRVDLLNASCGLHSREMWPCVPPMAAIAAGTAIGPLRRRLISSVTGIDFALSGAPADLLARQLERPALLASAISLASADSDLVLLTTPEAALAEAAQSCCQVPVLLPPLDTRGDPAPEVVATLFTAGVGHGARLAPGLLAGAGRALVPEQATGAYRISRPSRDRGTSVTVG